VKPRGVPRAGTRWTAGIRERFNVLGRQISAEALSDIDRNAPKDISALGSNGAPICVRSIVKEVERLGVDPRPLFRGLGFAADDLDVPGFLVSHQEAITVIRRAMPAIGKPDLGVELGSRSHIVDCGALGLGLLASSTLAEAIDLNLRFARVAGFLPELDADRFGPLHIVFADPLPGSHDVASFLVDAAFARIVQAYRSITNGKYSPAAVEFVRRPPTQTGAYENHFKCPVRFGCWRNRLLSASDWLAFPLPGANRMSFRLAWQILERQAATAGDHSDFGPLVARAVRRALPRPPSPAEVAASLHVSERTMRRRLQDAGLSYHALLDECRKSRALELIVHGRLPLAQVTQQVGFADLRSLRRAFKRWTGKTPSRWSK
jgi:AraC-like DNA-binding protein